MGKKQARTRLAELNSAVPQLATSEDFETPTTLRQSREHTVHRSSTNSPAAHRINLKAVSEALIDEGLDPATEIARVLKGRIKLDDDGNPLIDPATGEPVRVYAIDEDVRVRTLNEVLQYTQPKLKAIEVKMSGTLDMSTEQLDTRLAALIAKAAK